MGTKWVDYPYGAVLRAACSSAGSDLSRCRSAEWGAHTVGWCNPSRSCTVKASQSTGGEEDRGRRRPADGNVANWKWYTVLLETQSQSEKTCKWTTTHLIRNLSRAWLSPLRATRKRHMSSIYCYDYYFLSLQHKYERQHSFSGAWKAAKTTLLTDEVENFLKTWLAVHNIMAVFCW